MGWIACCCYPVTDNNGHALDEISTPGRTNCGSFLAAMGGALSLWVAVTAAIASAYIGWSELRNLDDTLKNYSKVVLELMFLNDC